MGRKKKTVNRDQVRRALLRAGGVWWQAARHLKVSKSTFYRWLAKLGIAASDYAESTPKRLPAPRQEALPAPHAPKLLPAPRPAAKPERDARILTAADFGGACYGEAGGSQTSVPPRRRSADELIWLHDKQK